MTGFGNGLLRDDETSMATRAAWLHYAGGLTQSEVAKRLGLTSLKAHRLIPIDFTPMCSPEFIARSGPLTRPADLLRLTLLDWRDDWWRQWFALAGIPNPQPSLPSAIEVDSQVMLGRAAMTGQGVAILTPAFFTSELEAGSLIRPFDLVGNDTDAYWLVYQRQRANVPKIRAFREWILAEVAGSAGMG